MIKRFVFSIMAAMVAFGCQVENLNDTTLDNISNAKVFTATIEDNASGETKTFLDAGGNVLWKQGDQVSIFAASTLNEQYQVSDDSDGKTAATLNKVGGSGFVAGTEIENNVAFYPYASTASIAKSGGSYIISDIELPATQNYAAGSFGNGAFPMAAVTGSTEDTNLKFKNILGGLKLQLKGTATIASITITGKNNEKLYGDAEVTVTYGGTPSISLTDASAKTVTLNCGAWVALNTETATPFIIALPPITMTGGFTVVVTDTEGKQMEISTSKSQTITRSSLLKMPAVNYLGTSKPFTITSKGNTTVSIQKYGTPDDIILEYRTCSDDWASYTIGSGITLIDGVSLQFRAGEGGNDTFSQGILNYYYIEATGTGTIDASGNIMSLLDRSMESVSVPQNVFWWFFKSCTKIVGASQLKLPATTLSNYCYYGMFQSCTGLTSAPKLPATKLADFCYDNMFSTCTSLASAPELPATTLSYSCYGNMFSYCTGLTSAPELSSTSLSSFCYDHMFSGCTSLLSAPALPATSMRNNCYQYMFSGCTGLTSAPVLPATTLAEGCYECMFQGCFNLNYVKALFTTRPSVEYTMFWLDGVSDTGTFVKSSSATWDITGSSSAIPSGWTIITE